MDDVQEVMQYRTSDGKIFGDKAEAAAHQGKVRDEATVDVYLAVQEGLKASTKTRTRNAILDFLAWQKGNTA